MDKIYNSPPRVAQRGRGNGQTRYEKEVAASGGTVDTHGDPHSLGPWVLGDTIGKGSSVPLLTKLFLPFPRPPPRWHTGRVRLARHNQTGKLAAVKIIPKNIMFSSRMSISNASAKHEKLMLGIRREIVIMKLIDHPNIMSLYDVFEADNELYLLLEYIEGGELFDFLVSKGRLAPPEALKYFREIIYGVDYCHRFNIAHRDLKPENLLLDSNKNIKIADFGMAAMEISNGMLETSCGSPHYASPEIVAGKAYHGSASDIWSCGVVLFALL
ncbi:Serine/threonine-protein kinase hsl1, partial [Tulasnella sp. 417]